MAWLVAILLMALAASCVRIGAKRDSYDPRAKAVRGGAVSSAPLFRSSERMGISGLLAILMLTGFSAADTAQAQVPSPTAKSAQDTSAPPESRSDIVVKGLRIPEGTFSVRTDADRPSIDTIAKGEAAADARFFSQCVKPIDNGSLHELIDGQPNRPVRTAALQRILHAYIACYRQYPPSDKSPADGGNDCNGRLTRSAYPVCQSFYDRGALVERVLQLYAPDLHFTTAQLFDPPVLARFHARQDRFDRSRSRQERIYTEVTNCLVATHPDLALAYPKSAVGSETERKLRIALIGLLPECVGNAKQVHADPPEFRVFMADAIYSWAVALKGTESLIPYDSKTSLLR